jgi:hypothetical protein
VTQVGLVDRLAMRLSRIVTGTLAAVVALTLAACGGGSSGSGSSGATGGSGASGTTSASSYVHQLCTAISGFEASVQSGETALNKLSEASHPNLVKLRTEVTAFFTSAAGASNLAKSQIVAAGTPDVTNGSATETGLVAAFQKFSAGFTTAAKQSKTVDTSSCRPSFSRPARTSPRA